jgi:UDP:flavonoid glycosyltransferase YjiC (YdhE family)
MSRILYAWELGGNYGHIGTFLPLGLRLRDRGHDVIVAAKDLSRIDGVLGKHDFPFLQCPTWLAKAKGLPEPQVTYADILLRVGFIDKTALAGLVKAWRQLFVLIQPDLLIVDHGPRALLAAYGSDMPRVLLGNGFYVPPPVSPMPSMRPWMRVPLERFKGAEEKVLENANAVLADLGAPGLNAIHDLFKVDENFMCTLKELDPYHAERNEARYWGPVNIAEWGARPPWPRGEGKKVFAYLSAGYPNLEKVLQALSRLHCSTLAYVSQLPERVLKEHSSPSLYFSKEPVDMSYATETCDIAVCHAGPGTATAMLLAGRPLLLLPVNLESALFARSVEKEGAGLIPTEEKGNQDYRNALLRVVEEKSFSEKARSFARRYADLDQDAQLSAMVDRCEEIMSGKPESRTGLTKCKSKLIFLP